MSSTNFEKYKIYCIDGVAYWSLKFKITSIGNILMVKHILCIFIAVLSMTSKKQELPLEIDIIAILKNSFY